MAARGNRFIDLQGKTFGRLMVIEEAGRSNKGDVLWKCLCDCGTEIIVRGEHLRNGSTHSCGCFYRETRKTINYIHGQRRKEATTKEYQAWTNAKTRCYNSKSEKYLSYGGRGIRMCDEWKNSFEVFYRDMGACPKDMTLERKDVNGDYCLENCVWASQAIQDRNRRTNVWHEHDGEKMIQADWARKLRVHHSFIINRLNDGLSFETIYGQAREFVVSKHWHEDLRERGI